jgi:hypothetical protein
LPLGCEWDGILFTHSFLIMPRAPTPLLDTDILARMKTHVLIGHSPNLLMPLVETETDSNVWADGGQVGSAQ